MLRLWLEIFQMLQYDFPMKKPPFIDDISSG